MASAGQVTTLLGPSGCGKTTTLRMVAGLETPSFGEIRLGDQIVYSSSQGTEVPVEERGVGMVFQSYAIWPHLSIFENVAFGLRVRRFPKEKIKERVMRVLDMVRLAHRADDFPSQLSGGQQQRVVLARALAYDPEILLLDEPLANLDAKLREAMRFELREIQKRTGVTTLYVTHDQAEAMVLSDQILVMNEGRIEQAGSPVEIYEFPESEFVANFIGSANFIPVSAASLNHGHLVADTPLGPIRCALPKRETGAQVRKLLVRPEDLRVCVAPTPENGNAWPGIVRQRVYLGESVSLVVESGGICFRTNVPRQAPVQEGSEVFLQADPEDIIPLTR